MSRRREQILEQLREAERSQRPMQLERDGHDVGTVNGFVVSVTEKWVAVQTLTDAVHFNGYEVVRVKHVTRAEEDWAASFIERALAVVGRPKVDFVLPPDAITKDVLAAAAQHSTMIAAHFEKEEGDPMWVGHLEAVEADQFSLWFVHPDGEWDPEVRSTPYSDVTRVSFGDRYTTALERFGEDRQRV